MESGFARKFLLDLVAKRDGSYPRGARRELDALQGLSWFPTTIDVLSPVRTRAIKKQTMPHGESAWQIQFAPLTLVRAQRGASAKSATRAKGKRAAFEVHLWYAICRNAGGELVLHKRLHFHYSIAVVIKSEMSGTRGKNHDIKKSIFFSLTPLPYRRTRYGTRYFHGVKSFRCESAMPRCAGAKRKAHAIKIAFIYWSLSLSLSLKSTSFLPLKAQDITVIPSTAQRVDRRVRSPLIDLQTSPKKVIQYSILLIRTHIDIIHCTYRSKILFIERQLIY